MRIFLLLLVIAASGASAQTSPCALEQGEHAAMKRAPLLSQVASGDAEATYALHSYLCVYSVEALGTTADLLRALALRDSVISRLAPRVENWFFTDSGERYEDTEAFYEETRALALEPVQAEGMLFGLTYGPLLDGVATVLAPPDVKHYLDFVTAEGNGAGGEYPFGDMESEVLMVLAGERLRAEYPSSPYIGTTQEAFSRALLDLASLHPVRLEGMDEPQWFAGVATSEFYPWAADREPLAEFVRQGTGSRYHAPLAAILADPPEAAAGDMNVVVLGEPYSTREDAAARSLAFLEQGLDVVGPLYTDGLYRVAYRYFPVGDARTGEAVGRLDALGIDSDVILFSPEVY